MEPGLMTPPASDLRAKALRVHELLIERYGESVLRDTLDPLSELVLTILSQNTADTNSGRAYDSLRERFPTWEAVLEADPRDLAQAIHIGGLANIKAPRIQRILRQLQDEHSALQLDFLGPMSVEEARGYLLSLPGVGPKTAACVLLFALRKPVFPVDTHVHRVTRRIGLAPARATPEKVGLLLEELLPEAVFFPFHVNLIRHGRAICRASKPRCEVCPVAQECDYLNLGRQALPAQPSKKQTR
jgi:endonuclease-3